jgi:hypothetical protein
MVRMLRFDWTMYLPSNARIVDRMSPPHVAMA